MIKRSVVVQGHATSVRLESQFWEFIDSFCVNQGISLNQLIISLEKQQLSPKNLASQLRVFCLTQALHQKQIQAS